MNKHSSPSNPADALDKITIKPTTNFSTLPRELRQKNLHHTFKGPNEYDMRWKYHNDYEAVDLKQAVIKCPNLVTRTQKLSATHPTVAEGVEFVASQWRAECRVGWDMTSNRRKINVSARASFVVILECTGREFVSKSTGQ